MDKTQTFTALGIAESCTNKIWSLSYVTSLIDILLFSDEPTTNLGIIIIILPTHRPEIIFPTARAKKKQVAFT